MATPTELSDSFVHNLMFSESFSNSRESLERFYLNLLSGSSGSSFEGFGSFEGFDPPDPPRPNMCSTMNMEGILPNNSFDISRVLPIEESGPEENMEVSATPEENGEVSAMEEVNMEASATPVENMGAIDRPEENIELSASPEASTQESADFNPDFYVPYDPGMIVEELPLSNVVPQPRELPEEEDSNRLSYIVHEGLTQRERAVLIELDTGFE